MSDIDLCLLYAERSCRERIDNLLEGVWSFCFSVLSICNLFLTLIISLSLSLSLFVCVCVCVCVCVYVYTSCRYLSFYWGTAKDLHMSAMSAAVYEEWLQVFKSGRPWLEHHAWPSSRALLRLAHNVLCLRKCFLSVRCCMVVHSSKTSSIMSFHGVDLYNMRPVVIRLSKNVKTRWWMRLVDQKLFYTMLFEQ